MLRNHGEQKNELIQDSNITNYSFMYKQLNCSKFWINPKLHGVISSLVKSG